MYVHEGYKAYYFDKFVDVVETRQSAEESLRVSGFESPLDFRCWAVRVRAAAGRPVSCRVAGA